MGIKIHVSVLLCLIVVVLVAGDKKRVLNENYIQEDYNLQLLLQDIIFNNLRPYKCIVILCDSVYLHTFRSSWFKKFELFIPYFMIFIADNEDMYSPFPNTNASILMAKKAGCQAYVIFLANGIQVLRFLTFGDKYRVIDTRANFVMLYDKRLFQKPVQYLWKRIINVVFVRQYEGSRSGAVQGQIPWFEITTVPFPSAIGSIFVPRRLDIWRNSKFRSGADLFRDKTSDIRNQTLKVVVFAQIPAVAKIPVGRSNTFRTLLGDGSMRFSGLEIELLEIVSKAMNFAYELYDTDTELFELWGTKADDGGYSGLFGEMIDNNADIALGNLYYTPTVLDIMDLTIPYHTECITFLTPESLTDNSWKTLVLPFKPVMWAAVVICLILCGVIFYWIARFHYHVNQIKYECMRKQKERLKKNAVMSVSSFPPADKQKNDLTYTKMREQYELKKFEGQPEGLYLFGEIMNSLLYTYSMLLLVSIPKLPTGWSLRMLTGWYWLYCTLVVVAYRASMTAILASPSPRVTIDTLQQLVDSRLPCGGWGEVNREFFKTSLDPTSQLIGSRFEMINSSDVAAERVAEGKFAFYENIYFLQELVVRRQISHVKTHETVLDENNTQISRRVERVERNLHIMSDCVIKMPISLGLQKNSPMKKRMDKLIRRTVEAGLITKWLNDVMQSIANANVQSDSRSVQAVMNIRKFSGAVVALIIGYICGIVALAIEIIYFNCYVKKHPDYDKYRRNVQRKNK